jgi:hypothetical protein
MRITYLGTIIHGIVLWGLLYYVRNPFLLRSSFTNFNVPYSYLSTTRPSRATHPSSPASQSSQKPAL